MVFTVRQPGGGCLVHPEGVRDGNREEDHAEKDLEK